MQRKNSFFYHWSKNNCENYFDEVSWKIRNDSGPQSLRESEVRLPCKPESSEGVVDGGAEDEAEEQDGFVSVFLKKQAADDGHEDKTDEIAARRPEKFSKAGAKGGEHGKANQPDDEI